MSDHITQLENLERLRQAYIFAITTERLVQSRHDFHEKCHATPFAEIAAELRRLTSERDNWERLYFEKLNEQVTKG